MGRIFHQGHFEINTDSIATDSFTTTVFPHNGNVIICIDEANDNYGVSVELTVEAVNKLITQLNHAVTNIND